jgi:hydroxymethylpyrimidine pyrophosphatase-like HAD family hydrolase
MPSEQESPRLQPFAAMPGSALARLRVLAADIDDTITAGGKLPARTLDLLGKLEAAGLVVVLVTGRPAGWAQALAGYLPGVSLVVGENGLVSFDGAGRRRDLGPPRDASFARALADNAERVARAFALIRTPDDTFRLFERAFLRPDGFDANALRGCQQLVDAGFEVMASSIHIHVRPSGWDKADGLLAGLAAVLPAAVAEADASILFVGDSSNDRPLFARFSRTSVGVHNVVRFLAELGEDRPAYITEGEAAAGFAEVCERLLAARRCAL